MASSVPPKTLPISLPSAVETHQEVTSFCRVIFKFFSIMSAK